MLLPRGVEPSVNGELTAAAFCESQMPLRINSSGCVVVIDGPGHAVDVDAADALWHCNLIDSANGLIELNEPDFRVSGAAGKRAG